jgi:hypothetical protein
MIDLDSIGHLHTPNRLALGELDIFLYHKGQEMLMDVELSRKADQF